MAKTKHPKRRAPTKSKVTPGARTKEKRLVPVVAPASTGLLSMLEGLGDDKTAAMHEIHIRLATIREFIDEAIEAAEGELKSVLTALRSFLF
jgi:hypothetical protein